MTTSKAAGFVSVLVLAGLLGAACSSSPAPTTRGTGTTPTTVRVPPRQHATGSTSTTAAAATSTTAAGGPGVSGAMPTLGLTSAWARVGPSVAGFGQVRPAAISLGGDPTGQLTGITWQSWGGATATGTGVSTYVAPGQTVAQGTQQQATVEAFDLGTCAGAPAYQKVKWFFPEEGESLATGTNNTVNTCTGP